jgi:glycerophosphoryl diester phosphodiesterase
MQLHLQGHRGARGNRPENTFSSIEFAIDCLVDSIETDLHLCADEQVVLFHDHFFSLPQSNHHFQISEFNLQALQAVFKNVPPVNERFPLQEFTIGPLSAIYCKRHNLNCWAPPTLDQFFDFVDFYAGKEGKTCGKTIAQQKAAALLSFDLEIKQLPYLECKSEIILHIIKKQIGNRKSEDRIVLRSFDHTILKQAKKILPDCTLGLLADGTIQVDMIREMIDTGASLFCPKFDTLNKDIILEMHRNQFKILPWTANNPTEWEKLQYLGVDGITTDFPEAFRLWQSSQTQKR